MREYTLTNKYTHDKLRNIGHKTDIKQCLNIKEMRIASIEGEKYEKSKDTSENRKFGTIEGVARRSCTYC